MDYVKITIHKEIGQHVVPENFHTPPPSTHQTWKGDLHCLQRLTCLVERTKERTTTMLPAPKNNAAAGYQGPVKIELFKGAGLLGVFFLIRFPYSCRNTNLAPPKLSFDGGRGLDFNNPWLDLPLAGILRHRTGLHEKWSLRKCIHGL